MFTLLHTQAEIMSSLSHPHICRAFGYSLDCDGSLYLLMELCDGSLDDLVLLFH